MALKLASMWKYNFQLTGGTSNEQTFTAKTDLWFLDLEYVDEEQIYEIIDNNGYGDISMDELELDDYDDFMQL